MPLSDGRPAELELWKKLSGMNEQFGVILQEFQNLPPHLISASGKEDGKRPRLALLVSALTEQLAELEVKFGQSRSVAGGAVGKKAAARSKKRPIEKRVTKDRKIKYVPIPKLANFHPAAPESVPWTHERRNELFKSVFQY